MTEIVDQIDRRAKKISNRELLGICGEAGEFLSRNADPHFCHEIAEAAINSIIKDRYAEQLLADASPPKICATVLKPLAARLPTQTWRSREQTTCQQFSTSPAIAYLLAYLLNLTPGEPILEPSAGTGSLAVWAGGLGLKTHTNEIDSHRRELLEILGFQPTTYNAEFVNDFLSGDIRANVLMMNPPFSASGGRTDLRVKGKIDDGMEDLKANSVRIVESPQVLFTDAATGANTIYHKLEIVVPTRPALFEEISQTGGVYFYEHRARPEFVAALPSPAHTNPETGERLQMFSVSRPAGYNLAYISEAELNQKYKIVAKTRARAWWTDEQKKIPPTEQKTIHLLSGALLPIWKSLKKLQQDRLNIVRTTTDDGKRLVGVNIPGETIGEIRRAFGLWRNTAANAAEILRSAREENETIELLNEVKIRLARFQGQRLIEVMPASYEQIRELRETALVNIIQNSRNQFFLPENEDAARETLEKVLKA